ncbi:hypothetical protein CC1G_05223 [Coprinopsis cinerea okayama7|uniref:DUF1275 domain-containing protein n=1 Tax=Coprinopsis cinerea (strain Okayama-7 / 130 / ATCC MYA-4618 / FGSC 9003) TaxID=240176 RepID=A8PC82_COPC7|nr:hypothetical protein CC1G_05223 [Coprinopsis cinerea okayama7\|eukprot:XP_001840337.2 hypothetical protein CC1G_05223 [Coprinopsis cinerea okayama7\
MAAGGTVESEKQDSLASATAANSVQGHDPEQQGKDILQQEESTWMQYLMTDVDPKESTGPLAAFCFMTGYMLSGRYLAIARLWEGTPGSTHFHRADQQALCSLIAFNAGSFLGRIGDKIGPQKRLWLVLGTFIQALLTMAGAIAFWKSGQNDLADTRAIPAWSNVLSFVGLAFISASLGLQGVLGKRLNTAFGTTIVLTTVWVELMTDPSLFNLRQKVISRDLRLIAASSLFLGAFIGRAILAQIGYAGTLGVAVGLRVLISIAWAFVRSKPKNATPPPAVSGA